MNDYKVLSSLSYFSIFLAPFLLPLIIFFASSNSEVKYHAKRAFLSHLIPIVASIVLFIFVAGGTVFFEYSSQSSGGGIYIAGILFMLLYGAITLGITIWNVIQGIKVLR